MIEINITYTLEIYKEFFWFSLFRGKYYRYGKMVFPIITILSLTISILSFFTDDLLLKILPIAMTVICVLFYLIAFLKPKIYFKKSPALFQSSMKIIFNKDDFSSLQTGDMASGTGVIKYEALHKAYETQNAFYLYLTPGQAILISKKDFVNGTTEELRDLLQSKLQKNKYIFCK